MSSKKILIIDDDKGVLHVLKTFLETECGYKITTAMNAMDGLTSMMEHRYDLVISDINMPAMSGLEMVMRIKASYPDVKIVMISGASEPKNIVKAVKLGADDFLPKPFDLEQVKETVKKLLKGDNTRETRMKNRKPFYSFGDYDIIKQIGSGGMGIVYEAKQKSTGDYVAVKMLYPRLIKETVAVQRFLRESRVIGLLDHPNIVRGIDVGESNGTYYIVMEYIKGEDLSDVVEEYGPFDVNKAFKLIRQLFDALVYIHSKNLIHRDIKPTNILITAEDIVKLVDLGLTKHVNLKETVTEPGFVPGTAGFMAPEAIFEDDPLDIRADIYSLGGTIYYMLTGELPFEGESFNIFQQQKAIVPSIKELNVEISDDLNAFFQKMMAINREDRFETPQDMAAEFEKLIASE